MRGICLAAVVVAAVFSSGCSDSAAARATLLCSVVCDCEEAPIDDVQEQCVQECVVEAAPVIDLLSNECIDCITQNAGFCVALENTCDPICENDVDPEPDPVPPPDPAFDAGMP